MSSEFYDAFAAHLAEQLRLEHLNRLDRAGIGKKNPKKVTVFVPPELDAEITSLAEAVKVSKSSVMRYLLRQAVMAANIHQPEFHSPTKALLNRDPEKNKTSFEPTIDQRPVFRPPVFGEEL